MEISIVESSSAEKRTNMKKKKGMGLFFIRVRKAMKNPFLCSWNKVEPLVSRSQLADPEPSVFLIRGQSSTFESVSLSSTPDNTSETTLSLSEDSDEREGKQADRLLNGYSEEMSSNERSSGITASLNTVPGEMPVYAPTVVTGTQSGTDVCPVDHSATEEPTNGRMGFLMRLWVSYLLLCCIRLPDSVEIPHF